MVPTVKSPDGFPACVSFSIEFNQHANYYQTAADWLKEEEGRGSNGRPHFDWVSPEERQRAIDTDSIWICQWYPHTPIGFVALAASSFEILMSAVNALKDPKP